jgi:hypothetical protein
MSENRFEQMLKDHPAQAEGWAKHIIAVADTMYICKAWFESYAAGLPWTPADIVAMAKIVIERESRETSNESRADIAGTLTNIADSIDLIQADVDRAFSGGVEGRGYVRIMDIGD